MKTPLFVFLYICLYAMAQAQKEDTVIRNVQVSFRYSPDIFPKNWQYAPINAFGDNISSSEVARSKTVIAAALRKYPPTALHDLAAVYFLSDLRFFGVYYGGTNSANAVYLVNRGKWQGYTDTYLEQTFHHEFSSILLRNYPLYLDTIAWKNSNEPGFIYSDPENGVGAIRNNRALQELDTLLCSKGMLTQYGCSSIENDVNTFAQQLFCPDRSFWQYVDRFPRVKKKINLLIGFYHKIDNLFSEQYFRKQMIKH